MTLLLPTLDQILALHETGLGVGGSAGVRDLGLIEGALAGTATSLAYNPLSVPEAACLLATRLVKAHGFVDGNKRTAALALLATLALNGWAYVGAWDVLARAIIQAATTGSLPDGILSNCTPAYVTQHLMDYDLGTFS
jgi:death-on-curing protein